VILARRSQSTRQRRRPLLRRHLTKHIFFEVDVEISRSRDDFFTSYFWTTSTDSRVADTAAPTRAGGSGSTSSSSSTAIFFLLLVAKTTFSSAESQKKLNRSATTNSGKKKKRDTRQPPNPRGPSRRLVEARDELGPRRRRTAMDVSLSAAKDDTRSSFLDVVSATKQLLAAQDQQRAVKPQVAPSPALVAAGML